MRKLGEATHKAINATNVYAEALEIARRKRKPNLRNRKVVHAKLRSELRTGQAVVIDADGYARPASYKEKPFGVIIGTRIRQNVRNRETTVIASVAQDVERPVETRKVAGSRQPGAPVLKMEADFSEVEKRAVHGMLYGMSAKRFEDLYGGGSRGGRTEQPIGTGRATQENDHAGSESEGVFARPAWLHSESRPSWYDEEGSA